jgi:hypothetical protein
MLTPNEDIGTSRSLLKLIQESTRTVLTQEKGYDVQINIDFHCFSLVRNKYSLNITVSSITGLRRVK